MEQFLKKYYHSKYDIFYLFYLNRDNKKKSFQRYTGANRKLFHPLIDEAIYKNKNRYDIYFSLNTFTFKDRKIMRSKNYVKEVRAIYFDIDEDAVNIKNTIENIDLFSSPTFTIQTSAEKYQLIYMLDNPLTTNFSEFEQVLKFLTQYFNTDATFDISRIFRIPNLINNKNGFSIKYNYQETTIDFEKVKQFATDKGYIYHEPIEKIKKSKSKRLPKKIQSNIKIKAPTKEHKGVVSPLYDITQYKDIPYKVNAQYDYLLRKYDLDKSTADLAYCRWLYFKKKLKKDTTIIKRLISARGYDDLILAHPYIDDYLTTILEKCKYENLP